MLCRLLGCSKTIDAHVAIKLESIMLTASKENFGITVFNYFTINHHTYMIVSYFQI